MINLTIKRACLPVSAATLFMALPCAHAGNVTSIIIKDVGSGASGTGAPDGISGAFRFGDIDDSSFEPDAAGHPCHSGSYCFDGDQAVAPGLAAGEVDLTQANPVNTFSQGFGFPTPTSGFFVPYTSGPSEWQWNGQSGPSSLTIGEGSDFPYGGAFGGTNFYLAPDPGTVQVFWVQKIDATTFKFKVGWSHQITCAESPAFCALQPANWRLEGIGKIQAQADATPPTVTNITPSGTNVPPNTQNITVTFSEPVKPGTATSASLSLGGGLTVGEPTASSGDTVFTFPIAGLQPLTTYTVTVNAGPTDLADNALTLPAPQSFTTAAEADTVPPQVTSITPANDARVGLDTAITVVFSEPVDRSSFDSNTTLTSPAGSTPFTAQTADNITFVLTPPELVEGVTYTLNLGAGITDQSSNPLQVPIVTSFTAVNTTPPTVTFQLEGQKNPANQEQLINVEPDEPIQVKFSKVMDVNSVTSAFTLTGSDGPIPVTVSTQDNQTFFFQPSQSLKAFAEYTATISTQATDANGVALAEPVALTFKTLQPPGNLSGGGCTLNPNAPFKPASLLMLIGGLLFWRRRAKLTRH